MSFLDSLKAAAARDRLRLHTPGHKGSINELDLTELTDDSFPSDALADAERRAASAYGAAHARFLCGGSSQGVKAAIFFAGANAIIDVNSHRSVFDGFKLSGKKFVAAGERGIYPLTVKQIECALTSDIGAIVVTSPTYYGFCADVDGIGDFCKRHGLLFIADSAHGAHFGFSDKLPESVAKKCDICNVSVHKTLCSLTQTAVLLDNLTTEKSAVLSEAADIMGTTSPSYLLYAAIDDGIERATGAQTAAAYAGLYEQVIDIKRAFPFLKNDDFTRLVLDCNALGVEASRLNRLLAARGVYSERTDEKHIIFILTAYDAPDAVRRLEIALADSIAEIE